MCVHIYIWFIHSLQESPHTSAAPVTYRHTAVLLNEGHKSNLLQLSQVPSLTHPQAHYTKGPLQKGSCSPILPALPTHSSLPISPPPTWAPAHSLWQLSTPAWLTAGLWLPPGTKGLIYCLNSSLPHQRNIFWESPPPSTLTPTSLTREGQ